MTKEKINALVREMQNHLYLMELTDNDAEIEEHSSKAQKIADTLYKETDLTWEEITELTSAPEAQPYKPYLHHIPRKGFKGVLEPLEATEIRKAIWTKCKSMDKNCKGCPYKYKCEEHFPYISPQIAQHDYIPADYVLNEDGAQFIVKT